MKTKLSKREVKKGDFDPKDIRNLTRLNPNIIKVLDTAWRSDDEKDPLNNLKCIWLDDVPSNKSLTYFMVINNILIKHGDTGTGIKVAMSWYFNLTTKMEEGRFIPNLFIEEQMRLGKKCEVYIEPLEALRRKHFDIETGETIYVFDGTYHKQRANYYKGLFKKYNVAPLLNRQERGEKENNFSRKYIQKYKERVLKYKEWRKSA